MLISLDINLSMRKNSFDGHNVIFKLTMKIFLYTNLYLYKYLIKKKLISVHNVLHVVM